MKTLSVLLLSFTLLIYDPSSSMAEVSGDEQSSPQATYNNCYSRVTFETPPDEAYQKINRCLTHTAQKALISYAVLGAHFIDSLKGLNGDKIHPGFLDEVNAALEQNGLLSASRKAFQSADLARALSDILSVYSASPEVRKNLDYSTRNLKKLQISGDSAQALETFTLKAPLPSNTLALSFVKIDDQWLINYISHRRP